MDALDQSVVVAPALEGDVGDAKDLARLCGGDHPLAARVAYQIGFEAATRYMCSGCLA